MGTCHIIGIGGTRPARVFQWSVSVLLLLGDYFPAEAMGKDLSLSKVTIGKNCIGFIVFLFFPKN